MVKKNAEYWLHQQEAPGPACSSTPSHSGTYEKMARDNGKTIDRCEYVGFGGFCCSGCIRCCLCNSCRPCCICCWSLPPLDALVRAVFRRADGSFAAFPAASAPIVLSDAFPSSAGAALLMLLMSGFTLVPLPLMLFICKARDISECLPKTQTLFLMERGSGALGANKGRPPFFK